MTGPLEVLGASAGRLVALVEPLTSDDLRRQAYPSEWTIADVLSHLGSGAVLTRLRLHATLAGEEVGKDVTQSVWDEWNAKSPDDQATDALRADRTMLDRLDALTDDERAGFHLSFGPFDVDFAGLVGLRLNEHTLHSWDIAVTIDPTATLPDDATELVVDTLAMIASFAGKPTGADRIIAVRTTAPTRHFEIALRPDAVTINATESTATFDLELPAEALVRVVYGRLDPDHTPPVDGSRADLDLLRQAFPGI